MRERFLAALLPVAILSALVLACFLKLVKEPGAILVDGSRPGIDSKLRDDLHSVGNDLTRFVLPRFLWMSEQFARQGRIPHWDPNGFGGRPNVGNPQSGLFYPTTWIAWWTRAPSALGWLTLAHLLWGGVGTYWLARLQGFGRFASIVSGGCYQLAPYLLAHVFEGHYPLVWSACWYPWAFGSAWLLRKGDGLGLLALPLVLSCCALTGHPQGVAYLAIALGAWAGFDLVRQIGNGQAQAALCILGRWGLVACLTMGLSAIEWLPDLLAQRWTLESERFDLRAAGRYHLHASNVLQLFHPLALGGPSNYRGPLNYWETVLSIGTIPLVLALIGARCSPARSVVRGWALLAILSIVFASGPGLGLFTLVYQVLPGMNRFRVPARALFLASLAGAMLAGIGIEAIRNGNVQFKKPGRKVATLLGCLAVLELTVLGLVLSRTAPPEQFLKPDPLAEAIAEHRPREPFRVRARDEFYQDLHAWRDGVEKTNRNDSFQIQHAADLYESLYPIFAPPRPFLKPDPAIEQRQQVIRQSVLDRFGVSLLVSDQAEPEAPWPVVERRDRVETRFLLYRNPSALPRAYVVPRASLALEDPSQPVAERLSLLSPTETVWLERDPLENQGGPRQPFTPASVTTNDPDRLTVRVTTQAPGFLVIAETWMPGWSARLNGRPSTVLRGDHAFRVIPLFEGATHVVELSYQAPGWSTGVGLTAGTAIAWLLLLGVVGASRRFTRSTSIEV